MKPPASGFFSVFAEMKEIRDWCVANGLCTEDEFRRDQWRYVSKWDRECQKANPSPVRRRWHDGPHTPPARSTR